MPTNITVFATGNGLTVVGNLTRRTLRSTIDPKMEQPELREFDFDPREWVRERLGELVVAALTVLRAYLVSGERVKVRPFGSFEEWSQRVREPLVWLGCADPVDTVENVRTDDPELSRLRAVLTGWRELLEMRRPYTAHDVIEHAEGQAGGSALGKTSGGITIKSGLAARRAEFKAALLDVANGGGGVISTLRLGSYLGRRVARVVDGVRLEPGGTRQGAKMWQLMPVSM